MRYFLLGLVLPFMVAHSFYWIFRKRKEKINYTSYKFFAIFLFALLQSSCFNLHVYFRLFYQTTIIEMPSLIRKKITRENCGTQNTRNSIVRHKKSFSAVHCILLTLPIFPQNPKTIWITTLLRSTVPQNLMSPSSVNIVFRSFQDFTLYVNIDTLNTECRSDQEQEMWMSNI